MIEVLVTVLVVSIGLLGLAALQGFSLNAGQGAYFRTQANNLAYEVIDFARVNRSQVEVACDLPLLESWTFFVEDQLPGGALAIEVDGCGEVPNSISAQVAVTVTWAEDRMEDAVGGEESLVVQTRI
ncbi:type IV pilus assembly protein PilV [Wenzhouxiangella marina]|nr:type IV pilus assembly protein PilV [Wenzhouxiangella marina]